MRGIPPSHMAVWPTTPYIQDSRTLENIPGAAQLVMRVCCPLGRCRPVDVESVAPPKSPSRTRTPFGEIGPANFTYSRIVASLNRKRDALPAFGGTTPKGECRSPVLDTETALSAEHASTH
jgi:hypothetical protein